MGLVAAIEGGREIGGKDRKRQGRPYNETGAVGVAGWREET